MSSNEGNRGRTLRSLSFRSKSRKKKSSNSETASTQSQHRHSVPEVLNHNNIASKSARLCCAVAIRPFAGILPCDLSFSEGARIDVLTRTDTCYDWWEGRLDGRTGIFPANYVRVVE